MTDFVRCKDFVIVFMLCKQDISYTDQLQRLETKEEKLKAAEDIRDYLVNYHRQKQMAEGDLETEDLPPEDSTSQPQEEEKKEVPLHVKMLEQVLERCVPLLAASDARLRLLVLRTVNEALTALTDHQGIIATLSYLKAAVIQCKKYFKENLRGIQLE